MPGSQSEAKSAPKKRSARQKPAAVADPGAAVPDVEVPGEVPVNERSVEDQVVDVAGNLNISSTGAASAEAAAGSAGERADFLARQRESLIAELATYTTQAEELKAQADSLALEHE